MAADYNLAKGEFVIMQSDGVDLLDGTTRTDLDEIVLTNQNLILVKNVRQGMFQQTTMLKRCNLGSLIYHDDVAQVHLGKSNSRWNLNVPFDAEVVTLSFSEDKRQVAQRWAESIKLAGAGNINAIKTTDTLSPEIADVIDGAKGILGAVLGSGAPSSKKPEPQRAARASAKCTGCRAPLTGSKGKRVTCPYCDTENIL